MKRLIADEVEAVADPRLAARIRQLLVEPYLVMRDSDYGSAGQQYPSWTVLEDTTSDTGIAYCEFGFGPESPWGLIWLGKKCDRPTSIGQDSSWFHTFIETFLDSFAAVRLVENDDVTMNPP